MRRLVALLITAIVGLLPSAAFSCGGFFCQISPIDQAGEEIIFSQQGNDISALVRIEYDGDAEDFSWVVPVPASLQSDGGISVGSDTTLDQLDLATRPQFVLDQAGQGCPVQFIDGGGGDAFSQSAPESVADADGGIQLEESTVGPFDVQVISSDNPDAMATWLVDNGYQLSDRGRDLIEPYVLDGMKFVGLKLSSGQSSGTIQPLILRYQSEKPMIPIRLTAVAAQEDMGVVVWVVGPSRAIPDNYLHVIPNYTRLNWYLGSQNAYGSYQTLITEAMNDAGGQGFATDMATTLNSDILDSLSNASSLESQLTQLDNTTTDAGFIAGVANLGPSDAFQDTLRQALPLPDGESTFTYFDAERLAAVFNSQTLASARNTLRDQFQAIEIDPLNASMALLPTGSYLTRLYTTLSADEMTLDPTFDYNPQMGDQPVERRATMNLACGDNGTEWTLTLGAGTGRDGETVIDASGEPPFGPVPVEVNDQAATFRVQRTSAAALPDLVAQNDFSVIEINGGGSVLPTDNTTTDTGGGSGALNLQLLWLLLLAPALRHRSA